MIMKFATFDVPYRVDIDGFVEMKCFSVAHATIPVMADIIEKATRPVLLAKEQRIRVDTLAVTELAMTEESLNSIRQSVGHFLREELRAHAIREGLAVITEPSIEESVDGGMLAFRCTATAMRLLEEGLR